MKKREIALSDGKTVVRFPQSVGAGVVSVITHLCPRATEPAREARARIDSKLLVVLCNRLRGA